MDLEVYSVESIAGARFTRPHAIISIADVAGYPADLPQNELCLDILKLAFYDVGPGEFPVRK